MNDRNIVVEEEALREGFTQIPNAILRDRSISCGAKVAYGMLLSYAWNKDYCYPGQKTMADDMGIDETTLRSYFKELVANEFITVKRRGLGLSNLYTILSRTGKSQILENPRSRTGDFPDPERGISPTNNTHLNKTQEKKTHSPYSPPTREGNATPTQQAERPTAQSDSGSRREPKARSSAVSAPPAPNELLRFVTVYPSHRTGCNSVDLQAAWARAKSEATTEQLFAALEKHKASWTWTNEPKYVPGIVKWLAEKRWKVDPDPPPHLGPGQAGYVHPQPKIGIWGVDY